MLYLICIYIFTHFAYFGLGKACVCLSLKIFRIEKYFFVNRNNDDSDHHFLLEDIFFWCFGLLVHLWITYLLYRFRFDLQIAFTVSICVMFCLTISEQIFFFRKIELTLKKILYSGIKPDFICFLVLNIVVGLSVIFIDNGIKSVWSNNYGDFTYHLGIITNFAFNAEPLIEYPIFPGSKLSYYFFVDFWTACLLMEPDSWRILSLVFFLQWLTCWLIIYTSFSRVGSGIFSYLLFFGGGSYDVFFKQLNALFKDNAPLSMLSHEFIDNGYPWTVFMSCIWIPQRAALFGLAMLVPLLLIGFSILKYRREQCLGLLRGQIFAFPVLGIYAALMLMVHFYFGFVALLLFGGVLTLRFLIGKQAKLIQLRVLGKIVLSSILFALPAFYLLMHKSGIIKVSWYWMPWESGALDFILPKVLSASISMWIMNAIGFFVILLLLLKEKRYVELSVISLGFIFFNVFQFGFWEWDSYKCFIALYVAAVCLFSLHFRRTFLQYLIIFLLSLPGLTEVSLILGYSEPFSIFDNSELYKARLLRQRTENDVIASSDTNVSIVTVAGRSIYSGYPGWLSSHGLDYSERSNINKQLLESFNCNLYKSLEDGPRYLYQVDKGNINPKLKEDLILPGLYDLSEICK